MGYLPSGGDALNKIKLIHSEIELQEAARELLAEGAVLRWRWRSKEQRWERGIADAAPELLFDGRRDGFDTELKLSPTGGLLQALVLTIVALCVPPASAASATVLADSGYLLRTWSIEDGLPENSATAIVQTQDGYLWFGTFNGLVRFSGVTFKVFHPANTPHLPSAGIVNLHADQRDRLWISTFAGLVMKDGAQWRALGTNEGWAGNHVRTFAERVNGDLLITTFDGHVMTVANDRLTELPAPPGERDQGYLGAVDEDGHWWLAQRGFVGFWNGQQWVPALAPSPSVGRSAVACASARGGGVWVLLAKELSKFRGGTEVSRRSLPQLRGGIWSMSEDSRTNLWICSYDSGLFQLTAQGGLHHWTTTNGLETLSTRVVFEDREENLWLGSSGGGLQRLTPRRFLEVDVGSGLTPKVARSVWPARDQAIWIALFDSGLFRCGETGIVRVPVPGPRNESAYGLSVLEDRAGRLWYGDADSCWWRNGQERFEKVPLKPAVGANVTALFEDSRGRVWIGTREGAVVCDGGRFRQLGPEAGLPGSEIAGFEQEASGAVWIAGSEGVFREENTGFIGVRTAEGQPLRGVLCLKTDADGAIWMGTRAAGLMRWRREKLDRVGAEHGLPDHAVCGILEDVQGYFWMPSSHGIIRARREQLHAVADGAVARLDCQVLDQNDGLPSAECPPGQPTCARDAGGRMWFATQKGVAVIDPARFRRNSQPPPVRVEQLTYRVPLTKPGPRERGISGASGRNEVRLEAPFPLPLRLPPGSYGLEIEYAALSYSAPEKVRYEFKLEGQGPDWQDIGNRPIVRFYQMQPGEYVFRVRAANHDGVWNEAGASLAFSVLPFYWQTVWFRATIALLLVGLGAAGAWLWFRGHVRRAGERERAAAQIRDLAGRLIDVQEKERARLARELHDDITQRLARLAIDVGRCELGTSEVPPAETARGVREGLVKLSEDVHGLSYRLHPSILEDLGLAAALRAETEHFTQQESVVVDMKLHEIPEEIAREPALCLFRVAQEALRNVARHAHARVVEISLRSLDSGLQLAICDDGCGFDPASQRARASLGLVSMRERVHSLGGELDVESAPGRGTTIVAWVPLEKARGRRLQAKRN